MTGVGMFKGCLRIEASYRVASPQRVTIDFEKATLVLFPAMCQLTIASEVHRALRSCRSQPAAMVLVSAANSTSNPYLLKTANTGLAEHSHYSCPISSQ